MSSSKTASSNAPLIHQDHSYYLKRQRSPSPGEEPEAKKTEMVLGNPGEKLLSEFYKNMLCELKDKEDQRAAAIEMAEKSNALVEKMGKRIKELLKENGSLKSTISANSGLKEKIEAAEKTVKEKEEMRLKAVQDYEDLSHRHIEEKAAWDVERAAKKVLEEELNNYKHFWNATMLNCQELQKNQDQLTSTPKQVALPEVDGDKG